jgi:hypothetical protein
MSKRETEMTLWYWNLRGGTLIEEYMAVQRGPDHAQRVIDGLILLGGEKRLVSRGLRRVDIRDKDVVAIQTKNSRLGMSLMGQTLFTLKLLESMGPRSIESIALCATDDAILRPLIEAYTGCKVVVCPAEICQLTSRSAEPLRRALNSYVSPNTKGRE